MGVWVWELRGISRDKDTREKERSREKDEGEGEKSQVAAEDAER